MSWEGSSALVWDAERLRIATDAAEVALWSWNVDTDEVALDERAHRLWGVPRRDRPITFEDLSAHIHPGDLGRVRAAFHATRATPGRYEIDFRVRHGDETRWLSVRSQGGDLGIVERVMLQSVAEHGRAAWQKASRYAKRSQAEGAIGRFKQVVGDGLRSRTDRRRATEVAVVVYALNRMLEFRRPISVRIA